LDKKLDAYCKLSKSSKIEKQLETFVTKHASDSINNDIYLNIRNIKSTLENEYSTKLEV
jgi:hypothetical protein